MLLDTIPDFPEKQELFFLRSLDARRVLQRPVNFFITPWKYGTRLPRLVADRNNAIEIPVCEPGDGFRPLGRDIDACLKHDSYRQRMDFCGLCAGAKNLSAASGKMPHETLRHLTAAGIARA